MYFFSTGLLIVFVQSVEATQFQGENDDNYRYQRMVNMFMSTYHPGQKIQTKAPKDCSGTYPLDFYCTRNKVHKLNFIFKIDGDRLYKIGQSPSVLEIVKGDFKQYKNLLGEQFEDLNSAILLNSNNFSVAEFTHLRRVIENFFMVEAVKGWSDHNQSPPSEEFGRMKFKERLNLIKDYLPEAFTENPSLYSIVSSGIHGLSEDACCSYFKPIKECILLSLDEMLSAQKKKKARESIQKAINAISSGGK